jgi:hypothetical protein
MGSKRYVPVSKRISRSASNAAKANGIAQRREQLLLLRQAGATYAEIVRAGIGYKSVGHVADDMKKVLAQFNYETPEDVLVLDLARLDEMQKLLTLDMRSAKGSAKVIVPTILQVMKFRRETLGITAEQITERQLNKTQVQNNGIMVIQGSSTRDYIAAMAQAAGVDPNAATAELERVSASNRIDDAVLVDDPADEALAQNRSDRSEDHDKTTKTKQKLKIRVSKDTSDSFQKRLLESIDRNEEIESAESAIPMVDINDALLNIDIVDDEKTYVVPIKDYDNNVNLTSGVSYKQPPRKLTSDQSKKIIIRKLKGIKNSNLINDELKTKTIQELI